MERKDMISVFYTGSQRAPSQEGGDTVSRGFSVWGGSNPQMLPSRRVLEPWCSRQPWVRVHSCSHAETQLKVSSLGPAERGSLVYLVSSPSLHLGWAHIQQSSHKNKTRIAKWWLNFTINIILNLAQNPHVIIYQIMVNFYLALQQFDYLYYISSPLPLKDSSSLHFHLYQLDPCYTYTAHNKKQAPSNAYVQWRCLKSHLNNTLFSFLATHLPLFTSYCPSSPPSLSNYLFTFSPWYNQMVHHLIYTLL